MNSKSAKLFILIVIITLFFTTPLFSRETGSEVVKANNLFTLELYQQLKNEGDNLLISPFSVFNAFGMLYPGSDGQTKSAISQTMHFEQNIRQFLDDISQLQTSFKPTRGFEKPALKLANSLWAQQGYPIFDSYLDILQEYFQSEIHSVDFSDSVKTANEINQWVSEKTNDKIEEIITPDIIDQLTTLILCNAIHFKGAWMNPFSEENTNPESFFVSPTQEIQANMMNNQKSYRYQEYDGYKMLEMPYRKATNEKGTPVSKADYSMIVYLPDEDSSLEQLENQLSYSILNSTIESLMRAQSVKVEVKFPKFRVENTFNLNDPLMAMGMENPFTTLADFSKITSSKKLFISDVIHKTYIDVDEKGTEAAAVTAIIMMRTAIPNQDEEVKQFHADRPFMYLIRENSTGSIIFIGKVTNPEPPR
ncbi:MAG: serpin family protein [Thermotogota bacterium]